MAGGRADVEDIAGGRLEPQLLSLLLRQMGVAAPEFLLGLFERVEIGHVSVGKGGSHCRQAGGDGNDQQ